MIRPTLPDTPNYTTLRGTIERSVKMESSLCEKPERHAPRRLSDYLMLEGQMQKVHSLVDKVYHART